MSTVRINVNGKGLLNYAKAGRDAQKRVQKAISRILNVGRTAARRAIASEFAVRTGFLKRQARKMQTKTTVKPAEIKGQVTPIPRLMNIFERGATLAQGRGVLRPRPVIAPAGAGMERAAVREIAEVLSEVGT
jgi:hypothetical protein